MTTNTRNIQRDNRSLPPDALHLTRGKTQDGAPEDPRRKQVERVIEGLRCGFRHRDALRLGGMSWKEFQSALPHHPDLADIYGPIDAANTQNACMGFSYMCRLIGREYRDILPQIAEPHHIADRCLHDKALEVARLLKAWIEQIERMDRGALLP